MNVSVQELRDKGLDGIPEVYECPASFHMRARDIQDRPGGSDSGCSLTCSMPENKTKGMLELSIALTLQGIMDYRMEAKRNNPKLCRDNL